MQQRGGGGTKKKEKKKRLRDQVTQRHTRDIGLGDRNGDTQKSSARSTTAGKKLFSAAAESQIKIFLLIGGGKNSPPTPKLRSLN